MTRPIDHRQLVADARIFEAPIVSEQRACTDRTFEVPTPILLGSFGLFMGYLGVMSLGFMAPMLVLPMVVNVVFVGAFAFVPAKWALMQPRKSDRALSWSELRERGLETATGHSDAGETATLVLLLPACVFLWGVAVVAIAALV
jgi:hypothetical protein